MMEFRGGRDLVDFRWRDRTGGMLKPTNMSTKHVFYTWLMIWNHAVKPGYRIWDNHRYTFGSFYQPSYMLRAFAALYFEIKTRSDLGHKSRQVVKQIEGYFVNRHAELKSEVLRITDERREAGL